MSGFDLLNAVQPDSGWFAVLGIKGKGDVRQKLVATREEVDQLAADYMAQGRNAFFGVAKYETDAGRTKDNVKALKAFWLDIDCREAKARVDEKTGRPDGYIDQSTALGELKRFCKLVGLPKPILVNSGRGVHVYWALTKEITREQWEPVADRLRELCNTHELYVDPAVFEVARVLRIPGTLNFKDDPATDVTIIHEAAPVELEAFRSLLGVKEKPVAPPKRELSELAKSLMDNTISVFAKIMRRSESGKGCQQLWDCYKNQNTLSEVRWFNALSVAKFCSDRDKAIHKMSEGYEEYDAAATEQKIQHIKGPHTCEVFERNNPGGCEGCPFKGKIKSPIVLGKEILEATEEDNIVTEEPKEEGAAPVLHRIPKYPDPYFRGQNGGVYYMPPGGEKEAELIYADDIYVVSRVRDPNVGDGVVIKLHMPNEGIREFTASNDDLSSKDELRSILSLNGVMCKTKQFNRVIDYIVDSCAEIRYKGKLNEMRLQFGWADNDSKFIIGDREISKDGSFYSPPSSTTKAMAEKMQPKGTLEKWRDVFNLYGKPGLEPHAFAALSAFGSPLLKFTGQSGALLNIVHPRSGTGKTTILHMINSVYGDPLTLCMNKEDTHNSRMQMIGVLRHLAPTIDEITNMTPQQISDLAYAVPQGRAKERMKGSTNELRLNATMWQLMLVSSSNSSLYEKLSALKGAPDGEMMRIMEYKIDYTTALEQSYAKEMFDHQLLNNYGHAGPIFADYLIKNRDEVISDVLKTQSNVDLELKITQRERFWSSVVACNLAGGRIAKKLGLNDWNLKPIREFSYHMVNGLRTQVVPPVSNPVGVVGDFLNRHYHNMLAINDGVDLRSGLNVAPRVEPKGELIIRYEPDTKRMFIVSKAFRNDCVKFQINYQDTVNELKKMGIITKAEDKRMGKGTNLMSTGVHTLIFDTTHKEFFDMNSFLPSEVPDAGGEG
jgi:hypothetical protein